MNYTTYEITDIINEASRYEPSALYNAEEILETSFSSLLAKNYFEINAYSKKYLIRDVLDKSYKGLSQQKLDAMRTAVLNGEKEYNSVSEQADDIIETAEMLKKAAFLIEYNEFYYDTAKVLFMIEVCKKMICAGASLSEILEYVPNTKAADVYELSWHYLGHRLELSKEERKLVEGDKSAGHDANTVNMQQMIKYSFAGGIPHKSGGEWTLENAEDTITGTASEIAQEFIGAELCYKYIDKHGKSCYADSLDAVLDKLMANPEEISFGGCEDSYSKTELELLERVKEKIINKA